MNGKPITYKVAIVGDSLYYINGNYKSKTIAEAIKESEDEDDTHFFYVYHFRALFKSGLNIIKHTYVVDLSSSVEENYGLNYILTAATRWSNRQIDDFTLKIDMGDFQDLSIEKSFFNSASEWLMTGRGKYAERKSRYKEGADMSEFYIQTGILVFQMKNFCPKGEINLYSFNSFLFGVDTKANEDNFFDSRRDQIPFSTDDQEQILKPANELSKQIMKNLPYARRGYVFKNPELYAYYEKQKWYLPGPTYIPQLGQLSHKDQDWLKKLLK